ncbi:MAG: hypothetical protein K2J37_08205 [Ruminococcus sp.]|nr:hypothetical protein [Ruminococcus sp.]MDE6784188.1 hypothetical protein [Ruminococcus sp.]
MKSYEEIAKNVLKRRDEYIAAKKDGGFGLSELYLILPESQQQQQQLS